MLGERGMWFKFNPYESSLRVPMIMQGPGVKAGHKEEALASLVDLMPTFADIANGGTFDGYVSPVDGRSLLERPDPNSLENRVFIESTGESLYGPAFIMIEGRKKLVYTRTDPKMFFDMDADPLELDNLAEAPEHQDQINRMFTAMMERWDEEALEVRIRTSQKKRMFVHDAMKHGRFPTWDFGPEYDPGKVYVRGGTEPSTTATKQRGRFPYVPVTPPQFPRGAKK
jgi:choline-sulfatase